MKSELSLFDWSDVVVLIADDDQYNHMLLGKVFQQIGATTVHAYDGYEAIEKLKEYEVTVAIIDIIMPRMNGVEVLQRIKMLYPETIFVAYTADIIRHNPEVCKELGFVQCFAKPILPVKLLSGINKLLLPVRRNDPL